MNLFTILNEHHKTPDRVTIATINNYLEQGKAGMGTARLVGSEISMSPVQLAMLLSYAGNLNQCLADSDYREFHAILGRAARGMAVNSKASSMTSTITSYVRKAAGY